MAEICQESNLTYPTDFIWSNSPLKDKFDAALACKYAQVHRLSRSHYSWDDNLKEVAGNDKYGHVDLFFAADTKFACLPEPYHDENNYVSKIANFVQQQLDLSYEYLKGHKPKVIIAVYKRAAEIFLKYHNSRTNQTSVSLEKNKPFQKIDLNFDKLKMLLIVCNDLPGMRNRTLEEKSEMIKGIKKLVAEAKNGQ